MKLADWKLPYPVGHRAKIRIICSMLAHWTHEKQGPIDVTSITPDDFSTWRLSGYNPRGEINPNPVAPAVPPGARAHAGGTPAIHAIGQIGHSLIPMGLAVLSNQDWVL
jgi:hypothetical protein